MKLFHFALAAALLIAIITFIPQAKADTLTVGVSHSYSSIQSAVDDASDGDTIAIDSGDYSGESVSVYGKHLHFRGMNSGAGLPTVGNMDFLSGADGSSMENLIFYSLVSLDNTANTLISNCEFNGGRVYNVGATYTTIEGCTFYNPLSNSEFIHLEDHSNNTTVRDCSFDIGMASPGSDGKIFVDSSGDFTLTDSVLTGSTVQVYGSNNVKLTGTTCTDSRTEFDGISGLIIDSCSIAGVDEPIAAINVGDSSNVLINGSSASGGRIAINFNNVDDGQILKSDIAYTSYYGIVLQNSQAVTVSGCNVHTLSMIGMALWSNNNLLIANNIIENNNYGFDVQEAGSNLGIRVYNNTFENSENVYYDTAPTVADVGFTYSSETPRAYTYKGTHYVSYMGNYWSDYGGTDGNGDGIGETPYTGTGVADNYPLVDPAINYLTSDSGTPKVQFSTGSAGVVWGNSYSVTLTRSDDTSGACSVDLDITGGNADPSQDYQTSDSLPYTVHFAPGETQQTFVVSPVTDYMGTKGIKNILFGLSNFQGVGPGTQITLNLIISHSLLNIQGVSPINGSDYVSVGTAVTATFEIDPETVVPASFTLTDSAGNLVAGSISVEYNKATFQPEAPLTNGMKYTARLTGIFDTNGNPLASDYIWSFTTEPVAPTGKVEWVRGGSILGTYDDLSSIYYWNMQDGDLIRIYSGIYHQHRFYITGKSVTVQGIDTGWGKPIIDGDGDSVFLVHADGVTFDNLRIRNASDYSISQIAGIWAAQSNNLVFSDCIFDNCCAGIEMPASQTTENGPMSGDNQVDVIGCTFNIGNSGSEGVYSYYGTDVTVDGCTFNGPQLTLMCVDGAIVSNSGFNGCGLSAMATGSKNTDNVKVKDCTFSGSSLIIQGLNIGSEGRNYEVTGCKILENGRIAATFANGVNIHDNEVISGGVSAQLSKNVVIRNINDKLDPVADNVDAGVWADGCPGVIIDNVHIRLYHAGAGAQGAISISQSDNAQITNCISCDNNFPSDGGYYTTEGIRVVNSNGVTVENCNASNNGGRGIYLYHQTGFLACDGNTIKNCTFDNNYFDAGIVIESANSNTITGNEVRGNYNGIEITDGFYHTSAIGHDNLVYNNNVTESSLKNGVDASVVGTNHWNSLAKRDYTYQGQLFNNYVGNYWGDYAGTDSNNDGIGDSPYTSANVLDNYPMIIEPVPDVSFTASTLSGTAPLDVDFTDTSTHGPLAWDWNFGDGSQHGDQQNLRHTYENPGTYTVTLTASNAKGAGTPATRTITVALGTPSTDFSASPRSGPTSLTVQFTDASAGGPTTWDWDFGDGGTSTDQNPSHTYDTIVTRSYNVKLTTSNSVGGNIYEKAGFITVTAPGSTHDRVAVIKADDIVLDDERFLHDLIQANGYVTDYVSAGAISYDVLKDYRAIIICHPHGGFTNTILGQLLANGNNVLLAYDSSRVITGTPAYDSSLSNLYVTSNQKFLSTYSLNDIISVFDSSKVPGAMAFTPAYISSVPTGWTAIGQAAANRYTALYYVTGPAKGAVFTYAPQYMTTDGKEVLDNVLAYLGLGPATALPVISFSSPSVTANEGTTVHIMLHRSGDTSGESSVLVTNVGGTAVEGKNYTFVPVTITFVTGQPDSGFDVRLPANSVIEPIDTYVNFSLSLPINAVLGDQVKFNLTIHDTTVPADTTPPVTVCRLFGTLGNGGWNTTNVRFELTATDHDSGIDAIYYTIDGRDEYTHGNPAGEIVTDEGWHTLVFHSTDLAGQVEADHTVTFKIDKTAPTTENVLDGTPGSNGWYTSNVTVHLNAADNTLGSGWTATTYELDGTGLQPYIAALPPVITTNGTHTLTYYSTDVASNNEAVKTLTIKIDKELPGVSYRIRGFHEDGLYQEAVVINVDGTDGYSGVQRNFTQQWVRFGMSYHWEDVSDENVRLSDDGSYTLRFGAVDYAGNTYYSGTTVIKIDSTVPVTTCTLTGTIGGSGWYTSDVIVHIAATDTGGSGVSVINYQVDSGSIQIYDDASPPRIATNGTHTLTYDSTDVAGNVETAKTSTINVDKEMPRVPYVITGAFDGIEYTSAVDIAVRGTDGYSGVQSNFTQEMKLDLGTGGLTWQTIGSDITHINSDGSYTLRFGATDKAGNTNYTDPITVRIAKPKPVLSFRAGSATANEGSTVQVFVDRTGDLTFTSTCVLTISGTVTASDYTANPTLTTTITFAPGETSKELDIGLAADHLTEGDETLILNISTLTGATAGATYRYQLNIRDSSRTPPTIGFHAASATAWEGNSPVTVTLDRLGDTSVTSSCYVSIMGSSTASSADYTASPEIPATVTFAPGETSKAINISAIADHLTEGTETLNLALSGFSGATTGTNSQFALSIEDTSVSPPTLNFLAWSSSANEGDTYKVTIRRSGDISGITTCSLIIKSGSTASTADYSGVPASITFPRDSVSQTFNVTLKADATTEGPEMLILGLSSTNAAIVTPDVFTLTIQDTSTTPVGVRYVGVTPDDGKQNVPVHFTHMYLFFDRNLDPAYLGDSDLASHVWLTSADDPGHVVPGDLIYKFINDVTRGQYSAPAGAKSMVIIETHDDADLKESMIYTIHARGLKDENGEVNDSEYTSTFRTVGGPIIRLADPYNGQADVSTMVSYYLFFDQPMNTNDLSDHVWLTDDSDGSRFPVDISYHEDGPNTENDWDTPQYYVKIHPKQPLYALHAYTIHADGGGLTDKYGGPLSTYAIHFTTAWTPAEPQVLATSPKAGATDGKINGMVIDFDRNMDDSHWDDHIWLTEDANPGKKISMDTDAGGYQGNYYHGEGMAAGVRSGVSMKPDSPIKYSTAYTLHVRGVKDEYGNVMNTEFTVSFTTEEGPKLLSTDPTDGQIGVSGVINYYLFFDRYMDDSDLSDHVWLTADDGGATWPVDVSYHEGQPNRDAENGQIQFYVKIHPKQPLTSLRSYTIHIDGIADKYSGGIMKTQEVHFQTGWTPVAPVIKGVYPADGTGNISLNFQCSVYFDRNMDDSDWGDHIWLIEDNTGKKVSMSQRDYGYDENIYNNPGLPADIRKTVKSAVYMAVDDPLKPSTAYTLYVQGVKDEYGNVQNTGFTARYITVGGPHAIFTSPPDGAKNVAANLPITVYFDKELDPASVKADNVFIRHERDGPVAATLTYQSGGTGHSDGSLSHVIITPTSNLATGMDYTVFVTGVTDTEGYTMPSVYTSTIWTGTGPSLSGVTPAGGATGVLPSAKITATFTKSMSLSALLTAFTVRDSNENNVPGTVTMSGLTATFTPAAWLACGQAYTAHITGARDLDGNMMPSYSWGFMVINAPTVQAITPSDGAINQPSTVTISATFSEAIDVASLTSGFVVKDSMNNRVAGGVTYNAATKTATYTPANGLSVNNNLYVASLSGIKGLHDNAVPLYSWSFRTISRQPQVVSTSPANNAAGASPDTTISVTFSEDMAPATVQAGLTVKDESNSAVAGSLVYASDSRTVTFTPGAPLAHGEHYTVYLQGLTGLQQNDMPDYAFGFRVVYVIPAGNQSGPTLIPTSTPAPFQTTISGVNVNVNGDRITGPAGSDISRILTNGHVTIPAGSGTLTADITVGTPHNTGTITGVHVADSSPGTVSGNPVSVTVTADLAGLPSGSVTFSATVSDPPSERLRGYSEWLSGRGREVSGTPLAEIDVRKGGFTNADIVGGTAKITLTVKKPAGFSRTKPYTVIRHGDDGYEELTATYKSETANTVTFEILSPHGFSTYLLAETADAPTPVPTMTSPPSATPVPAPTLLLTGLAMLAGVMIMVRVRKN